MTGVTSNDSKESKEPLSFKGSLCKDFAAGTLSATIGTTGVVVVSATEGAIGNMFGV